MLYLVGRALALERIHFVRFDGTLSLEKRQRVLLDFHNDPNITVLLISIGSGGIGLNLTAATHVHLLEPPWNPMAESQALDRIHRLGQQNPVTTYKYIAKNTFDESIMLLQSRKIELAELALESEQGSSQAEQQRQRLRASL
ncbi:MAG: hypothetical protein MMC23_003500 [Stictis urceolatum]|nr:hypothetical protein [Stictis urceolata]